MPKPRRPITNPHSIPPHTWRMPLDRLYQLAAEDSDVAASVGLRLLRTAMSASGPRTYGDLLTLLGGVPRDGLAEDGA